MIACLVHDGGHFKQFKFFREIKFFKTLQFCLMILNKTGEFQRISARTSAEVK